MFPHPVFDTLWYSNTTCWKIRYCSQISQVETSGPVPKTSMEGLHHIPQLWPPNDVHKVIVLKHGRSAEVLPSHPKYAVSIVAISPMAIRLLSPCVGQGATKTGWFHTTFAKNSINRYKMI